MASSESSATWLSLFEEKKQAINESLGPGYGHQGAVYSGRSFRNALEAVDKKIKKHKASRLHAKLLPTYKSITELSIAVGHSTPDLYDLPPKDNLEAFVWWTAFALIERGCKAGADLDRLATVVAELNEKVPSFIAHGIQSIQFPDDKRVQKPLQEVYDLAPVTDPTKDKFLKSYINEKAAQFAAARRKYDVMVNQAAEDEARQQTDKEQPSLESQRTLPDSVHEHSNSNTEIQVSFASNRALGSGSFGDVDEVRELTTGISYARKHIHIEGSRPNEVVADEVKNEVAIMQKLRHSHIATVLFYLKEPTAYSIFMLPVADYNLQEFMGLCTEQGYPAGLTKLIYPWFGCLLDALAYAHQLNIKHQDIKPSNILIKNNEPYLCDFGLAKDFTEFDNSVSNSHKPRGTLAYRAPEVQPHGSRGRKADVFSLGCVYSEMVTIGQGTSVEDYRQARQRAGSTAFRDCLTTVESWLKQLEKNKLSEFLIDEILGMICSNPEKRHTAHTALNYLKRERAFFCIEQ
ncbi:MAG: hypothetical protein Q9225_004248 [Loekoesia sp. 1 TL-2023]